MPTMLEKWTADAVAKGEARGEARGKAETVLTVLRARFKRVPKDVEQAILKISDLLALGCVGTNFSER